MPKKKMKSLVLIPGWGLDGRVFADLARVFAEKYNKQVKIVNLPGYGEKKNLKIHDGLDAVVESLLPAFPDNADLVGWSLGGMVAIGIAVKLKHGDSSIVLLASTPCFVRKPDWAPGIDPGLLNSFSKRMQTTSGAQDLLEEFSKIISVGDKFPRKTAARLINLLSGNRTNQEALLQGLKILAETDLRQDLGRISGRVVMLLAENDRLIASTTGAATKTFCPSLLLDYIPNSGHAPFVSELNRTAELLYQYLDY